MTHLPLIPQVDLTKAMAKNTQLHDTIYSKNQKDLEVFLDKVPT